MFRKSTLYSVTKGAWLLLAVAVAGATYVGVADPYLPWSTAPGPAWALPGAAVAAGALGWGALTVRENRSWTAAGRRADLVADGPGIVRKPDLTGEVRGRPVRAHVYEKQSGGGDGGSSKKRYTVVEADLGEPAETGVIIVRTTGSPTDALGAGGQAPVHLHREGDYGVAGESETLVAGVLTDRVRRALDDVARLDVVYAGGAGGFLPDMGSSTLGSLFAATFTAAFPGDRSTVATETEGVVLNGDELRARVEAVAAVADAFENAMADERGGSPSGGRDEGA